MADRGLPYKNPDAQAQTLSHALGNLGGRQKSWMMGANVPGPSVAAPARQLPPAPKRPRGRPRKYPQDDVQQVPLALQYPAELVRAACHVQTDKQPLSNSTSPYLSNMITRHDNGNNSNPALPITMFPSPSPTEDNSEDVYAPARTRSTDQESNTNVDYFAVNCTGAPTTSSVVPATKSPVDAPHTSPLGQREPERARLHIDIPQQQPITSAAARTTTTTTPTTATTPGANNRLSPIGADSNHMRRHSQQHVPHGLAHPSQEQLPASVSRVPSTASVHQQHATDRINSPLDLRNMSSAQSPVLTDDVQSCMRKISMFKRANPTATQRDDMRLQVLSSATESQDWTYLDLHQLYCALSTNADLGPAMAEMRAMPETRVAQIMLQRILDRNEMLSFPLLSFFADCPLPLSVAAQHAPARYHQQVQNFVAFAKHAPNYDPLVRACTTRQCPPLAHELYCDLAITSPVLRRLVFVATLRVMCRPARLSNSKRTLLEQQASVLYNQNQDAFQERQARAQLIPGYGPRLYQLETQNESAHFMSRFQSLLQRFITPGSQIPLTNSIHPGAAPPPRQPFHHGPPAQSSTQFPLLLNQEMPQRIVWPTTGQQESRVLTPQGQGHYIQRTHQQHFTQLPNPRARPLLPPPGILLAHQRQPNPVRFSLHQAHLRSPILKAKSTISPLYHFFESFAKPPERLTDAQDAIIRWTFTLPPATMNSISRPLGGNNGAPDTIRVDETTKTIRLRCIKWRGETLPTENEWAVTDSSWAPHSYFTFNGKYLEQRRKVHNGKDLPIDITGLISDGDNVLEISVVALSTDTSYLDYIVAIEIMGIAAHDRIVQHCVQNNRMHKETVLQQIQSRLAGPSTTNDDEMAIVESNISISLVDPFSGSSTTCHIPVRASSCRHNDCFDLETFLQTRRRKGDVSDTEVWRCPICGADARPRELMVDGWVEYVYEEVRTKGLRDVRTVVVGMDGNWRIKEAKVGEDEEGDGNELTMPVAAVPVHDVEVIDLSD